MQYETLQHRLKAKGWICTDSSITNKTTLWSSMDYNYYIQIERESMSEKSRILSAKKIGSASISTKNSRRIIRYGETLAYLSTNVSYGDFMKMVEGTIEVPSFEDFYDQQY